jgi:hypothetical protein
MRLSEWRAVAPKKESVPAKVNAIVDPVLASFGVGRDPECWVAWGDEPAQRYTILVPTAAGLTVCYVRVNVPGEGARAAGKLIRWNRVQLGELAIETQGGHRLLSFQVEQLVLRGADDEADRIAAFALDLYASIDGRPLPPRRTAGAGRGRAPAGLPAPKTKTAKPASRPPARGASS